MKKHFSAAMAVIGVLGVFLSSFFLLTGCSQIKVASVWVDQGYQGDGINNVFVVGISQDKGLRRILEDEFVAIFEQRGVQAAASYKVFPAADLPDEENLESMIAGTGHDTILMTRVVDIRKEMQYIQPDYVYGVVPRYYRGWHGYYHRAYLVSPGYTVEYETAVLETNVYDLETDKLIWSARVDIPANGRMGRHIKDFARAIISGLAEAELLK